MKKSFCSFLGFFAIGAVVFAALQGWQNWRFNQEINALEEVVQSQDLTALLDPNPEDGANVDQAMRGVHLLQGKDGQEIWQLKAEWGTYYEESGIIELKMPDAQYVMGSADDNISSSRPAADKEETDYVTVRARTGKVNNNEVITMDGDVYAEYQEQTLEGPYAIFLTTDRTLHMEKGGLFTGKQLTGEADILQWDMETNIVDGEGRVKVVWTPATEE